MEEENRKPWENLGDTPTEQWRERKGATESSPKENSSAGYGERANGDEPRNQDFRDNRHLNRDNYRDGARQNRGGFKGSRDKSGFRSEGRDNKRGYGKRDSGGFGGRRGEHGNRDGWGSRDGRDERRDGYRDARHDNRRGGYRNDRNDRNDRHDGRRDDRRDGRRDRGDYGRSRTTESKRGQGSRRAVNLDLPASITWDMLDKEVWRRLSPLPKETAELVARHLVMSGELVDENPQLAYEHAKAALKMAWRIDVVREAVALTAYGCGNYAEALREVRTVRRMSGMDVLVAVEADCERGLGKPEKALEIIAAADKTALDESQKVELAIVESAARADLGEHETGLAIVEAALRGINPEKQSFEYGRLLSVKAERLRKLGQELEACEVEALIPREVEDAEIIDLAAEAEAEEQANPTTMRGTNVALAAQFPVIMTDLDGVTWNGNTATPGSAEGITKARELGAKVFFLTNNAARPPQAVVEKLAGVRITADVSEVVTSAQDGAAALTKLIEPGDKVLCVGGEGVATAVTAAGFQPVDAASEEPAAVLQGLGFDVGWKELSEACYAIGNGAKWVATNMDMALPTESGRGIGNGAFVSAVKAATRTEPVVCGKPEESIYNLALSRAAEHLRSIPEVAAQVEAFEEAAKAKREEALKNKAAQQDPDELLVKPTEEEIAAEKALDEKMAAKRERRVFKHHAVAIGDQLATDILGANQAGIASCVVMTGLTQPRDLVLAPQNQRPDFVALNLSDLALPFDRPELRQRGWWYCGDTRARINGETIEVRGLGTLEEGAELSLAEFRAVLAAAWYAREQGTRVRCPEFSVVREVARVYEPEEDGADTLASPSEMAPRAAETTTVPEENVTVTPTPVVDETAPTDSVPAADWGESAIPEADS